MQSAKVANSVLDELVNELLDYGLSKNEARVLTYLTKAGPERASHIARSLRMNRTETYRSLRNLERRGLIEATLEHPIRFRAVPFAKALDVLLDVRKNRIRALEQKSARLKDRFQSLTVETAQVPVDRFQVLEGRPRIDQKLVDMCESAKSMIGIIATPTEIMMAETTGVLEALASRASIGVKARVITEVSKKNLETIEKFKERIEFRHLDLTLKPIPRVSFIDDTEALFAITGLEEPPAKYQEDVALWIGSQQFTRNLRAYFQEMWQVATPAEARIEAIRQGIPQEELAIFKGRLEVRNKISQMLDSAKESVDIWTTVKGVQILARLRLEQLKGLRQRDVKVRIIAPITPENSQSARGLLTASQMRHSEALGRARVLIVDRKQLLLYDRVPDDDELESGADVGFWTNSERFIETMATVYDSMWKGVFAIYPAHRRGLRTSP